jgi:hypothetical protein
MEPAHRPCLIIDRGDLPAAARELRKIFAGCGWLFDRGGLVKVAPNPDGGSPIAIPLTANRVVYEAHRLCRPVQYKRGKLEPITVSDRMARMLLEIDGESEVPPLAGISTAPLLLDDGQVRTAAGYDPVSKLWCASQPALQLPQHPSRAEAEAALRLLRETCRTFPFADAAREIDAKLGVDAVNIDLAPGVDESTFLVGLLTAICRPSLPLAPGFLVRGPQISGAGIGKGLLVRSICAIAFGVQPRAFTKGPDRQELDKRLASDLVEAAPILFLDNVNDTTLRSDILASVLTERPARIRVLGQTQMVALNSAAFVVVTSNGVTVSEDLARRVLVCELDARCEDPEQRPFEAGILKHIEHRRSELLSAALTVWRWGRQAAADLEAGRSLGSFEDWTAWCRDPLLALGCRDPVERIEIIKADDPQRRRIVELFAKWDTFHGEMPIKTADLAQNVRAVIDPQGRSRQFVATYLARLAGTRAGGFVLTRHKSPGKWSAATYSLRHTGSLAPEA